jgi:hypothetical protein
MTSIDFYYSIVAIPQGTDSHTTHFNGIRTTVNLNFSDICFTKNKSQDFLEGKTTFKKKPD